MQIFCHIRSGLTLGLALCGLSLQSAIAKPLTKAEHSVCQSLRHCVDIVERHDASEYDYDVLMEEFRRFGPKGRQAVLHILNAPNAHSDMARLLLSGGPLTAAETARIDAIWSGPNAALVRPLFQEMTLANRDRWIAGLTHSDETVRRFSRRLYQMDAPLMRAPLTTQQSSIILSDMIENSQAQNGTYLSHISAAGHEAEFENLLLSGATFSIVAAAYDGLYKQNPAKAFQSLLTAMRSAQTARQITNLGDMIAHRHSQRADGFYAKFAVDFSNEAEEPSIARAVALQAWFAVMRDSHKITSKRPALPVMNERRLEALQLLLERGTTNVETYANVLDVTNNPSVQPAIDLLWAFSQHQNHEAQPAIFRAALDTPLEKVALQAALASDDYLLVLEAIAAAQARPDYAAKIAALQNHAILDIGVAATLARQGKYKGGQSKDQFLQLTRAAYKNAPQCNIAAFDIQDLVTQMPFFDDAPVKSEDEWVRRVTRKQLNAAHPTPKGWLAAYDQGAQNGALVYFDNQSGEGRRVVDFRSPFAILPERPLKIGDSTNRFWIVDTAGHRGSRQSLYQLIMTENGFDVRRVTELPDTPTQVGLTETGEVIIGFEKSNQTPVQPPLRISADGRVSSACAAAHTSISHRR